jgi:hypothetical protein
MTGPRLFHSMPWTPADDEQLKSMIFAGRTPREIATKLRRSASSVIHRASRLRLSFRLVKARKLNDRLVEMGLKAIGKNGAKRLG